MSVNDPFVVTKFAEQLKANDSISFIADGNAELTKNLDMGMDLSAVQLGHIRAKRFSMIIKRNSVLELNDENGA
eukprot:CAMPEP_0116885304 /NCGR_PEP_ID=MMETSP0463-20121206/18585_1 /TAXON_ID=181622 /ORGANISM="Strombidinopsis sp, Strain SopsisLIS2011" /LENGTH=73 /DNA_ID=CAMNT_0004543453 /DNA_START=331 /DNA_END=552 /DNA_ORIENTATION=-